MAVNLIADCVRSVGRVMESFGDSMRNTAREVGDFHMHQSMETEQKKYDERRTVAEMACRTVLAEIKQRVDTFREKHVGGPFDWTEFMDSVFGVRKSEPRTKIPEA